MILNQRRSKCEDYVSAPHGLGDIELAAVLTAALRLHDQFIGVIVNVADGAVVLEGYVRDAEQRQAAEMLVRGLDRIMRVQNSLELKTDA